MARYTESPTEPLTPSAGDRWLNPGVWVKQTYDGQRWLSASWASLGLIPSVTANNQTINAAISASILTAANGKSFTGTIGQFVLPAIAPVANGGGITLTGLNLSQGAITNAADSEAITIKQIIITGAAGVALATGVYTWSGIDITTPAQAANGAINLGRGIKITGGATAGGAGAYQRGIDITMAAATDNAIYVGTGQSYFGGNMSIGAAGFGTDANFVVGIGNGTAPTTAPANISQLWSGNIGGVDGKASLLMMSESGVGVQTIVGVITKTDTGDPAQVHEGLMCINTFDNTCKIYAESGWRTFAAW